MQKRIIVGIIAAIMLALMLVACSSNTATTDPQKSPADTVARTEQQPAGSVTGTEQQKPAETDTGTEQKKPVIAVSIVPEATFVKKVVGDKADIVTLIPPGNSPGNYEPTPQIMAKFEKSDIYFSIGVPTEKGNIIPHIAGSTKLVALADKVNAAYPDRKIGKSRDPHIWLSPKRAIVMIQTIAAEMSALDAAGKDDYEKNAKAYIAELEALDKKLAEATAKASSKHFIVYHPAFGYLADDYGLTMHALEKGGKEATPEGLIEMVKTAKEHDIKVVFYQAEMASTQAKTFAAEIGGKAVQLVPLSPDYIANLEMMAQEIIGQ